MYYIIVLQDIIVFKKKFTLKIFKINFDNKKSIKVSKNLL